MLTGKKKELCLYSVYMQCVPLTGVRFCRKTSCGMVSPSIWKAKKIHEYMAASSYEDISFSFLTIIGYLMADSF